MPAAQTFFSVIGEEKLTLCYGVKPLTQPPSSFDLRLQAPGQTATEHLLRHIRVRNSFSTISICAKKCQVLHHVCGVLHIPVLLLRPDSVFI